MATLVKKGTVPRTMEIKSRTPLQPLLPWKKKQGRPRTRSAPPALNTDKCVKKAEAMDQYKYGGSNESWEYFLWAAKDHGVPVYRISGKVSHDDKPGPKCQLLRKRVCQLFGESFGMERQKKEIQSIAGRDNRVKDKLVVSHGWFQWFMQHPAIAI